jgi:hypothetical protein
VEEYIDGRGIKTLTQKSSRMDRKTSKRPTPLVTAEKDQTVVSAAANAE